MGIEIGTGMGTGIATGQNAAWETGRAGDTRVTFAEIREQMAAERARASREADEEDDWRKMDDDHWNRLLKDVDRYIEEYKEDLKQRVEQQKKEEQEKAQAVKDGAAAPAIAEGAQTAASDALSEGAQAAADILAAGISSLQEAMLTGETTAGITKTAGGMEYVSVQESSAVQESTGVQESVAAQESTGVQGCGAAQEDLPAGERTWTITAFTEQGIICNSCTGGVTTELWRIDYQSEGDARRVQEFLDRFDPKADIVFARSKDFWEDFLSGKISEEQKNELIKQYNEKDM